MGRMNRPSRALLLVLLLILPAGAAPAYGPFFAPDEPGPWAVGRLTLTLVDAERGDRALPVDVWYPVDAADAVGPPTEYALLGLGRPSPFALDAPPPSRARRFPLVVFSHGSGGVRFQSFFLTEHLASHGFVVVAPDHLGNTLFDRLGQSSLPFAEAALARLADASFLVDAMIAKSRDPADPFHRAIHPFRIAAVGHSFGGFTALALAAGWTAEGVTGLPADFAPVPPDRRVRAIVPLAPASSTLSDESLAGIRVPALIVAGSLDTTTPTVDEATRPFERIARRAFLAELQGAVHFSFSNSCDLVQAFLDAGFPLLIIEQVVGADFLEPCDPGVLDVDEAHRLTNLFTVAHLQRYLNHDPRYGLFLREGFAARFEPDVLFEEKPALPLWLRWLLLRYFRF